MTFYNAHTHHTSNTEGVKEIVSINITEPVCDHTWMSAGIHPNTAADTAAWALLEQRLSSDNVLAIGECGLDRLSTVAWTSQVQTFVRQIDMANQIHKPIIVHCVRAFDTCLALLKQAKVPVVFHGFVKHALLAQQIVQSGHYISLGAALFQKDELWKQSIMEKVPLQSLLLETDAQLRYTIQDIYNAYALYARVEHVSLVNSIENNFKAIFNKV